MTSLAWSPQGGILASGSPTDTAIMVHTHRYSRTNVMAECLARQTPNHKIVGSSPAKTSWLIKNHPAWAMGGDNGASVHSDVNKYLAIDKDGNCT